MKLLETYETQEFETTSKYGTAKVIWLTPEVEKSLTLSDLKECYSDDQITRYAIASIKIATYNNARPKAQQATSKAKVYRTLVNNMTPEQIAKAVKAGIITQEQADTLAS